MLIGKVSHSALPSLLYPLVALACSDVFPTDYPKEMLLITLYRMYVLTSICNISLKCILNFVVLGPLLCMIYNMMQKSSATVCTCVWYHDAFVLGTMKVVVQDRYNCP